ncbi:MAG: Dabb family protein [Cyclonatronaceae bacterium]
MILHSVFFYLNDEAPAGTAETMKAEILDKLTGIASVREILAGPPQGIDRDVVDNVYNMSLHAKFDDLEDLLAYQADPIHVAFVEKFKPFFDKIRVFDTRIS